jgi:hypothetical protein
MSLVGLSSVVVGVADYYNSNFSLRCPGHQPSNASADVMTRHWLSLCSCYCGRSRSIPVTPGPCDLPYSPTHLSDSRHVDHLLVAGQRSASKLAGALRRLF